MIRRWCIPVATVALALGSLMATAASASASPVAHPAATHVRTGSEVKTGFTPGGLFHQAGGAAARAHGIKNASTTSTNWSGYAVSGSSGAYKSVAASWKEPSATCSSGDKYASFWVGLDGYSSDSVEQTGTDSDCDGRTAEYYGWYEMYPAYPVNFSNTVEPGDSMSASVTFSGTKTYTLVLKDTTRNWTQTITKNQSGLSRSSAEVITEAPSSDSGVLPLANFGTVTYSSSTVNGTSLGTQSPTSITMINGSGQDKDSTSSINSSGGFSNTWIRSS
jgi:hypothetical protein